MAADLAKISILAYFLQPHKYAASTDLPSVGAALQPIAIAPPR